MPAIVLKVLERLRLTAVEFTASKEPTTISVAMDRKLRRRQLTEDGNVEISGRDLL